MAAAAVAKHLHSIRADIMYVTAAYLTYLRCGQVLLSESVTGIRQAEGQTDRGTHGGGTAGQT